MSQGEPTKEGTGHRRGPVDVRCEVRAVDLDARRFVARLADGHSFEGHFPERFAVEFQAALQSMGDNRLRIVGEGEFDISAGELVRVNAVDAIRWEALHRAVRPPEPFEDFLAGLQDSIPSSDWARIPEDLGRNLDHYLYGCERDNE